MTVRNAQCKDKDFVFLLPFSVNTHYKVKCLPGVLHCELYLVHPV